MDGAERRATLRLLRYWEGLRRQDGVPWFSDFKPARNPVPWDHCMLVTLGDEGAPPLVEHLGAAFRRAVLPELVDAVLARAAALRLAPAPRFDDGELDLDAGRSVLYRSVWLPFRNNANDVRYGLAAATWRARHDTAQVGAGRRLRLVASASAGA